MPNQKKSTDDKTTPQESLSKVQGQGGDGGDKSEYTLAELATRFDVHLNQIAQWKTQLLERMSEVFDKPGQPASPSFDVKELQAKIGELTLENDFLEGALTNLRAYDSVSQARGSMARYLDFYTTSRPHSRLDRMTPDSVYFNELPQSIAA